MSKVRLNLSGFWLMGSGWTSFDVEKGKNVINQRDSQIRSVNIVQRLQIDRWFLRQRSWQQSLTPNSLLSFYLFTFSPFPLFPHWFVHPVSIQKRQTHGFCFLWFQPFCSLSHLHQISPIRRKKEKCLPFLLSIIWFPTTIKYGSPKKIWISFDQKHLKKSIMFVDIWKKCPKKPDLPKNNSFPHKIQIFPWIWFNDPKLSRTNQIRRNVQSPFSESIEKFSLWWIRIC